MASTTVTLRKTLSAAGLVRLIRCRFSRITDPRRQASVTHSLPDTLMAALAMFQFKCPSLLQFDQLAHDPERLTVFGNLQRLFRLASTPPASDTQMRRLLDRASPESLRGAFRAVHSAVQRGGALEDFKVLDGRVLVAIDGTALFGSTSVRCEHCGVVKRSNGSTHYYHQLLAAVVVSPHQKTVLPIDFEPIVASDGAAKDCCEANAAKRLIPSLARQYPKLCKRFVVNEDGLSANGPHVRMLVEHAMDFIIVAKPGSVATLFDEFDARQRDPNGGVLEFEGPIGELDAEGRRLSEAPGRAAGKGLGADTIRGVRFANGLSLNAAHQDVKVNLLEPQKPGLSAGAQLRSRRALLVEHARGVDAAELLDGSSPGAGVFGVQGGQEGQANQDESVGGDADLPARRGDPELGDAVGGDCGSRGKVYSRAGTRYRIAMQQRRKQHADPIHPQKKADLSDRFEESRGLTLLTIKPSSLRSKSPCLRGIAGFAADLLRDDLLNS